MEFPKPSKMMIKSEYVDQILGVDDLTAKYIQTETNTKMYIQTIAGEPVSFVEIHGKTEDTKDAKTIIKKIIAECEVCIDLPYVCPEDSTRNMQTVLEVKSPLNHYDTMKKSISGPIVWQAFGRRNPMDLDPREKIPSTVNHEFKDFEKKSDKIVFLMDFLKSLDPDDVAIVFCDTKSTVKALSCSATVHGLKTYSMHNNMISYQRARTQRDMLLNQVKICFTTDEAIYGKYTENAHYVINFDRPHNKKDYIFRTSRLGVYCGQHQPRKMITLLLNTQKYDWYYFFNTLFMTGQNTKIAQKCMASFMKSGILN